MKVQYLYIVIFLFLSLNVSGQIAPNFMITGTDSNTHNLYDDYLSQGKTVMFEIMFTTCPFCNSFASNLQPLYETWGAGAGDVEFFSFSNQGFDDNADIIAWKAIHGLTFPGAGADGGSLQVVSDYTSAGFGGFFGTPTFVVIAPDSTVTWNAGFGFSGAAKVQALHNAIAATGANLPFTEKNISGMIQTPDGDPVANVTLTIPSISDSLAVSGTDGNFSFSTNLDNNTVYILNAEKDINPRNGVSTFDLVLTAKHILQVDPFTDPYQLIAADANNSGSITTIDLVLMRKVILGIDEGFLNNRSWRFVLDDCNFTECGIDNLFSFTVNDNVENLSIIGIKVGDVNYSSNGQNLQAADDRDEQESLQFPIYSQAITADETLSISFKALKPTMATGFQFELNFDPAYLSFKHFVSNDASITTANFNFSQTANGKILVSWHDALGRSLHHSPLFHLHFVVEQNADLDDVIQINSAQFPAEYYNKQGRIGAVQLQFQEPLPDIQIFPNPVEETLNIQLAYSLAHESTLRIINLQGQVVATKQILHTNTIDVATLEQGLYFLEIETGEQVQTKRFIKK